MTRNAFSAFLRSSAWYRMTADVCSGWPRRLRRSNASPPTRRGPNPGWLGGLW